MENIKKCLTAAFNDLRKIPVKDVEVDLMASARKNLRIAYAELEKLEKKLEKRKEASNNVDCES